MAPTIVGKTSWTDRDLTEEGRRLTAIAVKKDIVGWIGEIRARWKKAQLTILIPPQIRQCVEHVAQNKLLDCTPRRNSGTRRKRRHRPHLRLLRGQWWLHFLPARRDLDRTEVGAGGPRWHWLQKPSIFAAIEKQWPEVEVHFGKWVWGQNHRQVTVLIWYNQIGNIEDFMKLIILTSFNQYGMNIVI